MSLAVRAGVPVPAFSGAAIAYYDSCRSARLPANIHSGPASTASAHTPYERVDRKKARSTFDWYGNEGEENCDPIEAGGEIVECWQVLPFWNLLFSSHCYFLSITCYNFTIRRV
ncbi:MAG: hypothetical protein U5K84_05400 [Alkalibacterium sp.]|nr:hypothetical protein [Alkalibacterium sp.]